MAFILAGETFNAQPAYAEGSGVASAHLFLVVTELDNWPQ
jgi:hypothetical protein